MQTNNILKKIIIGTWSWSAYRSVSKKTIENVFDENIDNIFGTHGASFEEGEPALHEHHEGAHHDEKKLECRFIYYPEKLIFMVNKTQAVL